MRAGADGLPETGETGRYLSVWPDVDIRVDEGGFVNPGIEGMSIAPPPVENLAGHRRPPEFGGTGKDPVYELETGELPDDLAYRPDQANRLPLASVSPGREIMRNAMEQPKIDIAERIADLALAEPYERALLTIRGYAAALLDTGYPRDTLYEDFERARSVLSGRGAPEEAEDTVLDVMDFLVGFSSSHMKL